MKKNSGKNSKWYKNKKKVLGRNVIYEKEITSIDLSILSVFLFISCGGSKETTGVKDTLVVANGADAKSLDPHATNDAPSSKVTVKYMID